MNSSSSSNMNNECIVSHAIQNCKWYDGPEQCAESFVAWWVSLFKRYRLDTYQMGTILRSDGFSIPHLRFCFTESFHPYTFKELIDLFRREYIAVHHPPAGEKCVECAKRRSEPTPDFKLAQDLLLQPDPYFGAWDGMTPFSPERDLNGDGGPKKYYLPAPIPCSPIRKSKPKPMRI
jgi:hypothetical protein